MLNSTKELLEKARIYFDELGYHFHLDNDTDESIDYREFVNCFQNTLNHTKTFSDTIEAIKMFRYLDKRFNRIIDAIYKYPDYFNSLKYGENEVLSLVSDDEAIGVYNISNAITDDCREVVVFSQTLDEPFTLEDGSSKYSIYERKESEYFLRYSYISKDKMVLLDKNDKKIGILKFNRNLDLEIDNNYTDYEVVNNDGVIFIYRKDKLEKSKDDFDAAMVWDILDEKSVVGLTRLEVYEDETDIELILLLAASCLLLFKGQRDTSRALLASTIAISSIRH